MMPGEWPLWFDKAGQPIDEREATALRYNARGSENPGAVSDYARIGLDMVGDARVSTVWIGLNHEFLPGRPPLIFSAGTQMNSRLSRYFFMVGFHTPHDALLCG